MDLLIFVTLLSLGCVKGQFFEDRRCKCVCPNPASVVNTTVTRQIFTGNVPPNKCDCEAVVFPLLRKELEGKLHFFCPRCECVYQRRNTTLIMAVVFLTLSTLIMAVLYMLSLNWLKALLGFNNRQGPRDFFQQLDRRYMHPQRQPERDYVREYRGEYGRNHMFRDIPSDSEEEELLNFEEDS